jgi:endonuclease YncB( thermonuclease family)
MIISNRVMGAFLRHQHTLAAALAVAALARAPALAGVLEQYKICGGDARVTCVIDGDTIMHQGLRIRMIDIDAPEIRAPKCASEAALGHKARHRLRDLLSGGQVQIVKFGSRDEDRYGRKLRLVVVNGRSAGDILITEGLAWPWEGRRHDWCRALEQKPK